MSHPHPDPSGTRGGGFLAAFTVLAAVAAIAVGVAMVLGGPSSLPWFAAFVGAFLLAPAALVVGLRSLLGDRSLRRPLAALRREEEALQRERIELEVRALEVEHKAQRVDAQWTTVQEAARKAAARSASASKEERADRKEIERLRAELQKRETADRQLSARIAELEAAQSEAETTLRGILDENRARLQAGDGVGRESNGEPAAAPGGRKKGVTPEERKKVRHEASTLLAVAAEKARLLIAEAEEKARLLKAQGEAELDAAIRDIQAKEELERTLAGRIAELEEARAAAEADLGRLRPGTGSRADA